MSQAPRRTGPRRTPSSRAGTGRTEPNRGAARRTPPTRGRIVRRRITLIASLALVAGIVTVAVLGFYIGNRALVAKDSLEAAQGQLTSIKSALGQPGAPSTAQMYGSLQAKTTKAARQVDDPVWRSLEGVPVVGPNLKAFRQTALLVNTLVHDGVGPVATAADGISVDSLKPKDGGIDIAPLQKLTPAIAQVDDALRAADASAAAIDTEHVMPQLQKPIEGLRDTIGPVLPVTAELRKVMPVLYPAMGGEGTRRYLLMFQNNAEERASGGNPASMVLLKVKHGKVSLGTQGSSSDFPRPYAKPVLDFKGDWDRLYGTHASTYVTNITMTPDFPTVAKLAKTMWTGQYGGKIDGVISFDPVALSYLLRATGPIRLQDGYTLTSDNAVAYLLNGVYAKYTDPRMQDAVFASAAQAVFSAVTSGQGDPKAYVAQLQPMMDEQRLKMWSPRADEQALLLDSPLGNMLPADNSKATVLGVYNNDDATSKMSFFMDEQVKVAHSTCQATPKYLVAAKVTNTLPASAVATLPPYVKATARRVLPGGDRQWVQLYGPVGANLAKVTIDGKKVVWGTDVSPGLNTKPDATGMLDYRPAVKGAMHGRPVGVVSISMGPGESRTVKALFTGGTAPSATVQVSHTPKVRAVPVEIAAVPCK